MSYDNRFSGAITITPPLTWAEIQGGPAVSDVRLRTPQAVVDTDSGQITTIIGDEIVPLEMGSYSGHSVVEDIQAIVDFYGPRGHAFAGHIQVQWDPGFGESVPERYVVTDGRVETVTPRLVWPGDDDLVDDARAVALACKSVLDQMPVSVEDFFEDDWDRMPDWFTGEDNGNDVWAGED